MQQGFKEFGYSDIIRKAHATRKSADMTLELYEPTLEAEQSGESLSFAKGVVLQVWEIYGSYTAIQLSNMTHAPGTPWEQVARHFNFDIPRGIQIPKPIIGDYFKALSDNSE